MYLTPRPASWSVSVHTGERLLLSVTCGDQSTCCLHALLRFNDDLPSRVTIVPLAHLHLDALQFLAGTKNAHSLAGLRTAATDSAVSWRPARVAPARPPADAVRDQCGLAYRHLICAVLQLRLSSVGPGNNWYDEAEAGSGNQCAMREQGNYND